MFNLVLQARPSSQHKHFDVYGDAFISCWLNVDSNENAALAVNKYLNDSNFELIEITECNRVNKPDINGNKEKLQLYNDSIENNEVYQVFQVPKYSIIIGKYNVFKVDERMYLTLEVWIDVEYLSNKIDPFKINYWHDSKLQKMLLKRVSKLIKPEGFKLINQMSISAIEHLESGDERKKYQDDVEEYGYSLIFRKPD